MYLLELVIVSSTCVVSDEGSASRQRESVHRRMRRPAALPTRHRVLLQGQPPGARARGVFMFVTVGCRHASHATFCHSLGVRGSLFI